MQPGKVVILLTGRYAGKKAVIVKNYDDGTSSRPYGHALVCGLSKEPRKVRRGGARCQAAVHTLQQTAGGAALAAAVCQMAAEQRGRRALIMPASKLIRHCCCRCRRCRRCSNCVFFAAALVLQVIKRSSQKTQARRSSLKVRAAAMAVGQQPWQWDCSHGSSHCSCAAEWSVATAGMRRGGWWMQHAAFIWSSVNSRNLELARSSMHGAAGRRGGLCGRTGLAAFGHTVVSSTQQEQAPATCRMSCSQQRQSADGQQAESILQSGASRQAGGTEQPHHIPCQPPCACTALRSPPLLHLPSSLRPRSLCSPPVQTFIKVVNYQHLMPTRYTLEVDLKSVVTADTVDNSTKKVEANKEAKALLEEKFKSGKNRWFFTRLR